jgi:hypothetical protein
MIMILMTSTLRKWTQATEVSTLESLLLKRGISISHCYPIFAVEVPLTSSFQVGSSVANVLLLALPVATFAPVIPKRALFGAGMTAVFTGFLSIVFGKLRMTVFTSFHSPIIAVNVATKALSKALVPAS